MKHTPGPWKVAFSNGYKSAVKSDDIVIARAYCKYSPPRKTYREMGAEAEANARLISAAPDLFDKLQHLLWRVEDFLNEDPNDEDEALIMEVKAALNKATQV